MVHCKKYRKSFVLTVTRSFVLRFDAFKGGVECDYGHCSTASFNDEKSFSDLNIRALVSYT